MYSACESANSASGGVTGVNTTAMKVASVFTGLAKGSEGRAVSTTMARTSLLRQLMRDEPFGARAVPIVPVEARISRLDSPVRVFLIYPPLGQPSVPSLHSLSLSST